MRQLWFTADIFTAQPGEEAQTNPGRLGQALARWLIDRLQANGHAVVPLPLAADWGWVVRLQDTPCPLRVGCGNEEGSRTRWGLFVEAEPGLTQRLFRRTQVDAAVTALEQALERIVGKAGFTDVEWE